MANLAQDILHRVCALLNRGHTLQKDKEVSEDRPPNPGGIPVKVRGEPHTSSCARRNRLMTLSWISGPDGAWPDTCECNTVDISAKHMMEHVFDTVASWCMINRVAMCSVSRPD